MAVTDPDYRWYRLSFSNDKKWLGACYTRAKDVEEATANRPTHVWQGAKMEVIDVDQVRPDPR